MEWLIIDVIYLRTTECYMLVVRSGTLKMMAEIISETPVQPGDTLYPVRDAIYLINKNESQPAKVISAAAFSASQWAFLRKSFKTFSHLKRLS